MKTTMCVSVGVEVVQEVHKRADEAGQSISRMTEDLLRAALGIPQTGVVRTHERQLMTGKEEAALDAHRRLCEKALELDPRDAGHGRTEFTLRELARESGIYPSQLLAVLRRLERRKLLEVDNLIDLEAVKVDPTSTRRCEHWAAPVKRPWLNGG
jgi:hypothetical protein